jgi:hypothetical protein
LLLAKPAIWDYSKLDKDKSCNLQVITALTPM